MKKILVFTFFITLASVYHTWAQEFIVKPGVKLGANFSTLSGDDGNDYSFKPGVHAGAVISIEAGEMFGLQGEFLLSTQGAIDRHDENVRTNLNYFTIPLLLKIYPTEGFNVHVGPQFGFLLTANVVGEDNNAKVTIDVKDAYKTSDLSLAIGAGYETEFGLFAGIRYNIGLSNIIDPEIGQIGNIVFTTNDTQYNQVIQLSVGYLFDLR